MAPNDAGVVGRSAQWDSLAPAEWPVVSARREQLFSDAEGFEIIDLRGFLDRNNRDKFQKLAAKHYAEGFNETGMQVGMNNTWFEPRSLALLKHRLYQPGSAFLVTKHDQPIGFFAMELAPPTPNGIRGVELDIVLAREFQHQETERWGSRLLQIGFDDLVRRSHAIFGQAPVALEAETYKRGYQSDLWYKFKFDRTYTQSTNVDLESSPVGDVSGLNIKNLDRWNAEGLEDLLTSTSVRTSLKDEMDRTNAGAFVSSLVRYADHLGDSIPSITYLVENQMGDLVAGFSAYASIRRSGIVVASPVCIIDPDRLPSYNQMAPLVQGLLHRSAIDAARSARQVLGSNYRYVDVEFGPSVEPAFFEGFGVSGIRDNPNFFAIYSRRPYEIQQNLVDKVTSVMKENERVSKAEDDGPHIKTTRIGASVPDGFTSTDDSGAETLAMVAAPPEGVSRLDGGGGRPNEPHTLYDAASRWRAPGRALLTPGRVTHPRSWGNELSKR